MTSVPALRDPEALRNSALEDSALEDIEGADLDSLCRTASELRDRGKGRTVTFSPKAFFPLTRLCRDFCGYCTFRQSPGEASSLYMALDGVRALAKAAEDAGCTEALFTLGERPEARYPEAREWLESRGYGSTLDYLGAAARVVIDESRLLPHLNPGNMSAAEIERLRPVAASMGIMLESTSPTLHEAGGAHERAPSKTPRARLRTIEKAGERRVAFTTGLLVGIGESRRDRIESLLAIRELDRRYGHVQEVIVQNFRAKPDTPMAEHGDASFEEHLWTVAVARLLLGPEANLQVPPNLSGTLYPRFLLAGINDWGGVSPITIDHVNPEAPWPHLRALARETEALGFELRARLPLYPEIVRGRGELVPEPLAARVASLADSEGYARWSPGRTS